MSVSYIALKCCQRDFGAYSACTTICLFVARYVLELEDASGAYEVGHIEYIIRHASARWKERHASENVNPDIRDLLKSYKRVSTRLSVGRDVVAVVSGHLGQMQPPDEAAAGLEDVSAVVLAWVSSLARVKSAIVITRGSYSFLAFPAVGRYHVVDPHSRAAPRPLFDSNVYGYSARAVSEGTAKGVIVSFVYPQDLTEYVRGYLPPVTARDVRPANPKPNLVEVIEIRLRPELCEGPLLVMGRGGHRTGASPSDRA